MGIMLFIKDSPTITIDCDDYKATIVDLIVNRPTMTLNIQNIGQELIIRIKHEYTENTTFTLNAIDYKFLNKGKENTTFEIKGEGKIDTYEQVSFFNVGRQRFETNETVLFEVKPKLVV